MNDSDMTLPSRHTISLSNTRGPRSSTLHLGHSDSMLNIFSLFEI